MKQFSFRYYNNIDHIPGYFKISKKKWLFSPSKAQIVSDPQIDYIIGDPVNLALFDIS